MLLLVAGHHQSVNKIATRQLKRLMMFQSLTPRDKNFLPLFENVVSVLLGRGLYFEVTTKSRLLHIVYLNTAVYEIRLDGTMLSSDPITKKTYSPMFRCSLLRQVVFGDRSKYYTKILVFLPWKCGQPANTTQILVHGGKGYQNTYQLVFVAANCYHNVNIQTSEQSVILFNRRQPQPESIKMIIGFFMQGKYQ